MSALLEMESLAAGYGKRPVLHDVSIACRAASASCLIGPNGAGKSTVLKAIMGQLQITRGAIRFDGSDITGTRARKLIGFGIAYVGQGRIVFPSLTVRENLAIGLRALGRRPAQRDFDEIVVRFPNLEKRLGSRAGLLSGGEQQMVAIGRALLCRPRLLLLDEPSLGLAPQLRRVLFSHITVLASEGLTILLVEQNAREALAVADFAYVLELGRNAYEGAGAALLADPRIENLYLGGRYERSQADENLSSTNGELL